MAVLRNLFLAASVLAPLVAAVPMPEHDKRAIWTNTVTDIVWVTVEETTTVWVDPSEATPAPAPVAAAATTAAPVPAQVTYTPTTMQTSTSVPAVEPVAAYTPPPAAPAPAESPSSSMAPVQAPSPASLTSPAVMTLQPKAGDGTCKGSGDSCTGDVTHWDGGLGACGWNVNTNSDYSIALPYAFMGTQSNGNPYCGQSVTLFNPASGTTVQATVGDKCMGCVDRAIDCTDILFNAITDGQGDGRMSGIEWWLN